RFHRNLVYAVADAIDLIFNQDHYADKVIERTLKRDKRWGSKDRAFIASTTYELVRYKRLYLEIAEEKTPLTREGFFRVLAVWATLRGIELPDWPEFDQVPSRKIKGRFDALRQERAIKESITDWLDALGEQAFGAKKWEAELKALNTEAEVILRANTLRIRRDELADYLKQEGIDSTPVEGVEEALILSERANVFQLKGFKDGWFEVQDASSQKVAPFLDVHPGQRVIDACAGAGGKALHLSALMENKGQLIALDVFEHKLKTLKLRARRAGAHNIETRTIDSSKVIKKLQRSADRVLVDAPCTGLGVLRRNPDAKWKIDAAFLERVVETQKEILATYAQMVKPQGKLVYATCSILPQENEDQVKHFLASEEGQKFKLIQQQHLYPSTDHYDGFFMALFEREA
ncbi:MAG: class I SAM-dependent methyltransferase, partial [Bacteroidetes bacterium]|nr:class I SAM-dependent methyltransferase [Bacteroidota bacterium]